MMLSKRLQVSLSAEIREFIKASTGNYGKAKIVLQKNKFYVESAYTDVLKALLKVACPSSTEPNCSVQCFDHSTR